MHRLLDMELIFPIRDEPSAQLMSLKAECLYIAGVISKCEEQLVLGKAAKALTASNCKQSTRRSDQTAAYAA
jgi:hypothetical protein